MAKFLCVLFLLFQSSFQQILQNKDVLESSGESSYDGEVDTVKRVHYKFLPEPQIMDHHQHHHQSGLQGVQAGQKQVSSHSQAVTTPAPRTALIAEIVGAAPMKGFGLFVFPLLIPLLMGLLAVMLLPFQLLTAPFAALAGRRLSDDEGDDTNDDHQGMDQLLQHMLQSTDCVQRISCEIGRTVKTPQVRSIIDQSFTELDGDLDGKWKDAVRGYVIGSTRRTNPSNVCLKFKCKYMKYV